MSDKFTSVLLPGQEWHGFAFRGLMSRDEAIKQYFAWARVQCDAFNAIVNAQPDALIVEQHTGLHVRKNVKVMEPTLGSRGEVQS